MVLDLIRGNFGFALATGRLFQCLLGGAFRDHLGFGTKDRPGQTAARNPSDDLLDRGSKNQCKL